MHSPAHPNDLETWIDAARHGSVEALGKLLVHYEPYLLRVANDLSSPLRGKAGASDLVQDTCLEAQRAFPRFEGVGGEDLLAWLRGILDNKIRTLVRHYQHTGKRSLQREVPLDAEPPVATSGSPSSIAGHREEAELVRQALARLSEQHRQVVIWRQWDGLPFAEIARRLGGSVDAARMVWWRALGRLQQELKHLLDEA